MANEGPREGARDDAAGGPSREGYPDGDTAAEGGDEVCEQDDAWFGEAERDEAVVQVISVSSEGRAAGEVPPDGG